MNNRKWNCKNPYQGSQERVLCVCSAGLLRSPTVAVLLAQRGYNTRAVGIEREHALISIDEVLLEWADSVVVMNFSQAEEILLMGFNGKIYNFNLPDDYNYMQKELVAEIEVRLDNLSQYEFY
jgi:predicted protein tyrosine phosphatase